MIAIYARVSTIDQTCEQQLTALREYASRLGGERIEFVETASGKDDSRPELARLLATVRAGDVILVVKLDRFGRSIAKLIVDLQELDARGVRFMAIDQGIDTDRSSATGRLLMHIMAAFAQFERDLISDRTKAGLARVRAAGTTLGRPRKAFDADRVRELAAAGLSTQKIASELGGVSREIVRKSLLRA